MATPTQSLAEFVETLAQKNTNVERGLRYWLAGNKLEALANILLGLRELHTDIVSDQEIPLPRIHEAQEKAGTALDDAAQAVLDWQEAKRK